RVSDPLSGVSAVTCNGSSTTLQSGSFSCPLTLQVGLNTITIQASDNAENTTTQSETVTLTPPPVIALVNPSSGQQRQQNLPVEISGRFTHFLQGATTASFGAG